MTADELRMTAVVGRLVLDRQSAEELGHVAQLLVDESLQRVVGCTCRGTLGRERRRLSWQQVISVGRDSVVVDGGAASAASAPPPDTATPAQLEVWSDAGERLGRLADYCFEARSGTIHRYLFHPEGWRGLDAGLYALEPSALISAGRRRMMVAAAAVAEPQVFEADWQPPTLDPNELLPDWEAARHQGQQAAEQLQQRTQQLADQAKGQVDQLLGRFQRRTRRLRGQLRETVTDLSEGLPAPGHLREDDSRRTIDVDSMEVWPEDEADSQP